jgi:anti-anti-sigma regulatory factor
MEEEKSMVHIKPEGYIHIELPAYISREAKERFGGTLSSIDISGKDIVINMEKVTNLYSSIYNVLMVANSFALTFNCQMILVNVKENIKDALWNLKFNSTVYDAMLEYEFDREWALEHKKVA